MKRRTIASVGIALAALVIVVLALYLASTNGSAEGEPVAVVIRPGWNGSRIADELERRQVVGSPLAFRIFARLHGSTTDLKAGEYRLRTEMPFSVLLSELRKGPPVAFRRLTIPEGMTVNQAAEVVGRSTHISAEAFLQAASAATSRPAILPDGVTSLEGFLYPSTYFVIENETPVDLVRRLIAQFEKATADLDWDSSKNLNRTAFETLVISSMIEEEAKVDADRPLISAVIHNRLRRGMKLEIDATVQYAVSKYGQRLTENDLNVDSPYNTRRYPGLPPGPISSPRVASIRAALSPADTDAIFFVLTEDCKHHLFTNDYDEFLSAKARQRDDC